LAFCLAAAPGFVHAASEIIPYRCRDLVVSGRIRNLDYQRIDFPGDLIGHGWVTMRVFVDRVLHGRAPRLSLTTRVLAHTFLNEQRHFLMVLSPDPTDGGYVVKAFRVDDEDSAPVVASHCDK
jgi:hypothetical protein